MNRLRVLIAIAAVAVTPVSLGVTLWALGAHDPDWMGVEIALAVISSISVVSALGSFGFFAWVARDPKPRFRPCRCSATDVHLSCPIHGPYGNEPV